MQAICQLKITWDNQGSILAQFRRDQAELLELETTRLPRGFMIRGSTDSNFMCMLLRNQRVLRPSTSRQKMNMERCMCPAVCEISCEAFKKEIHDCKVLAERYYTSKRAEISKMGLEEVTVNFWCKSKTVQD